MRRVYYIAVLIILSLLSLSVLGVRAAQAQEEPTPGVARVSLTHGDVTTMRGDSGDWVATTVNAPIVRGDKIATGERSHTEIQLDHANVLRLGDESEARIADLTRTQIQVQLAQGLMNYTVFKGNEADIEIDTPNVAVRPLREGSYRIQVNSEAETQVIVREGEAEVATPQGSTTVKKNELITIQGIDEPQYRIVQAPRRDDWDNWNRDRDKDIRDASSYRYANRYYTGAHDLDRYGRWVYVPDYEWCWTPYINLGWVPYRYGRWLWEPYWGWTWVSYEPWGWAPYHYGRWFLYANSWYWWPGYTYYGYYPTWAPAYVSFIGFGFGGRRWHFGFGFGFGSIGWLPLGPYDRYYPWHGRHNTYNVVNITNITNVTNVTNVNNGTRGRNTGNRPYVSNVQTALNNPRMREAITRVSAEDFVRGRVPGNRPAVDAQALREAGVVRGTLPAVPTRESLRPTDKVVEVASVRARGNQVDKFFSRRQPPAGPQPFNERAAEIREMMQKHNPLAGDHGTASAANANASRGGTAGSAALNAERTSQAQQERVGARGTGSELANGNRQAAAKAARNTIQNRNRESVTQQAGVSSPAAAKEASGANRPAASEQAVAKSAAANRPGWQRFGAGGAAPSPGGTARPETGKLIAQNTSSGAGQQNENRQTPAAEQTQRRGWERFGTGSARPAPGRSAATPPSTEGRAVSQSGKAATSGSQPKPANRATERPGWQRFGTGSGRPSSATQVQGRTSNAPKATPRETPKAQSAPRAGRAAPSSSSSAASERAAPRARSPSQPAPSEGSRSFTRSQPESQSSERPGWSRFSSRPEASRGGQSETRQSSPRGSERPPLQIRKPIVTEKPAPARRSAQGSGSGWSAPLSRSRSWSAPSVQRGGFEGSRSGSWSGSSRSSRSVAAPSSRGFSGGVSRGPSSGRISAGRSGGSPSGRSRSASPRGKR